MFTRHNQRGISLAELIMFIVSVALAGMTSRAKLLCGRAV